MPENQPLSPADLLRELRDHLQPWAEAKKGYLRVARDPFENMALLADAPGRFRIILSWGGDESDAQHRAVYIPKQIVKVTVGYGRGLSMDPGRYLVEPMRDQEPLLELISQVRAKVIELKFPNEVTSVNFWYKGCREVIMPNGIPVDAWEMIFNIHTAIPTRT